MKTTDTAGRIVKEENYRKRERQTTEERIYNEHGDILSELHINYHKKATNNDTNRHSYLYEYVDNRIVSENWYVDTVLTDSFKRLGTRQLPDGSYADSFSKLWWTVDRMPLPESVVFIYNKGLLMQITLIDVRNETEITKYEYYSNGNEKRRKIVRVPEPAIKGRYVGGPGSDDMLYTYKYDAKGRMLKTYVLVDNKTYKIASCKYKKL